MSALTSESWIRDLFSHHVADLGIERCRVKVKEIEAWSKSAMCSIWAPETNGIVAWETKKRSILEYEL